MCGNRVTDGGEDADGTTVLGNRVQVSLKEAYTFAPIRPTIPRYPIITADFCTLVVAQKATCVGRATREGGCNLHDGEVHTKSGLHYTSGQGTCLAPDNCHCPIVGFYSDRGHCRACNLPTHCHHAKCTTSHNSWCLWCDGDVKPGYLVYDSSINGQCQRTCSWRPGSRCYPGRCSNHNLYSSCKCFDGFTGPDCDIITKDPDILNNSLVLTSDNERLEAPPKQTEGMPQPTTWTNNELLNKAFLTLKGSFLLSHFPSDHQLYIRERKIGIVYGAVQLELIRGGKRNGQLLRKECRLSKPQPDNFVCSSTLRLPYWNLPFQHSDKIIFRVDLQNGGYIGYINAEQSFSSIKHYSLKPRKVVRTFNVQFDFESPSHCVQNVPSVCKQQPLIVPDTTTESNISIEWENWQDALSGVDKYEIEVYHLVPNGPIQPSTSLKHGKAVTTGVPGEMPATTTKTSIQLSKPGPYSVLLIVSDKAGNRKTARRLLIFDNMSHVELINNQSRVVTAVRETGYQWINKVTSSIKVQWPDRFQNEIHESKIWLNSVERFGEVVKELDDMYGVRKVKRIDNVRGIVKFEIGYDIIYKRNITKTAYVEVSDLHSQSAMLNESPLDGKRLRIKVRGFDIRGKFAEDVVNVTFDASPPVIRNLWLTKGDKQNFSVHGSEEFTKLTLEWDTFDHHSGVESLSWRLFDNYTRTEVVHGFAALPPQEKLRCNSTDSFCYCTPYTGCFDQHYVLCPHVSTKSDGLLQEYVKGLHDGDYYFELKVRNHAYLTTISHLKITIDTSPPIEGTVHDGIPGDPEVDFQQSLDLSAYWDGFFDKESGVSMYKYAFSNSCLPAEAFLDTDPRSNMTKETRSKHAVYKANIEGTYYVTVVAYNAAFEPSIPVCSDGVTVDTTKPKVMEVTVEQSRARERLVTADNKTVWFLDSSSVLHKLVNIPAKCRSLSVYVTAEEMNLFPKGRHENGTLLEMPGESLCKKQWSSDRKFYSYLPSITHLRIKWRTEKPDLIFDHAVGLSSTKSVIPDKMDFVSTKQHSHLHIAYPNVQHGDMFFIIIETITKSSMSSKQIVGPFVVDTSPPVFTGQILVNYIQGFLVAKWNATSFVDNEDEYSLRYKFAVGHEKYSTNVLPFTTLATGPGCTDTSGSIMCTALKTELLQYHIHGHHRCYVTIRAENTVGMTTKHVSEPYIHDIHPPSAGVVLDVNPTALDTVKVNDVDFQTDVSQIKATWYGFHHPHLEITYTVCVGTKSTNGPYLKCEDVGNATSYTGHVSLVPFQTYYVNVTAAALSGSVSSVSDGVTVIKESSTIDGLKVYDGHPCKMINGTNRGNTSFAHHSKDIDQICVSDISYQSSLNVLEAYIIKPRKWIKLTPDARWRVEEKNVHTADWFVLKDYDRFKTSSIIKESDMVLNSGRTYRFAVQLCAGKACYPPVYSTGVTVVSNPPSTGSIHIEYLEDHNKLTVVFSKFFDPDIEDMDGAERAMYIYEWAFTDNAHCANTLTMWKSITNYTEQDSRHIKFSLDLKKHILFNKCWRVAVRGYNYAGLSNVVSAEIKDCDNVSLVKPRLILDAIGKPVVTKGENEASTGQEILLQENAHWNVQDVDYTPFDNIISAVWPSMRYQMYQWGVLENKNANPTIFYEQTSGIHIKDPCSHPNVIKCGQTDQEYVNVELDPPLEHGKRYIVCIHANESKIEHERWSESLPELSMCTDGVTVDLTPPIQGKIWIGPTQDTRFQSTSNKLSASWNTFEDVEEFGTHVHATGIRTYHLAVGSSPGSIDIVPWVDVGITNHITLHNMTLQNGHTYYAAVKAFDFVNRTTMSISEGVTIDRTPPLKSDKPITIGSRHITHKDKIKACWRNVFSDPESGIARCTWAIGSEQEYSDIMPYVEVKGYCGVSPGNLSLSLKEGHAYYVSVRCTNGAGLSSSASSWAYRFENSSPLAGQVYDGEVSTSNMKDIDFQTSSVQLVVRWEGFHDAHSAIKEYHVAIGTCPFCDDVVPCQPIGIRTDFSAKNLHLAQGVRYYSRVTACNTADICVSAVSDGVIIDSSPPRPGQVLDGCEAGDIQYQASSISIGATWFGFSDAQSAISHYTWRAGTAPYSDDLLPATDIHSYEIAVVTNILIKYGHSLPTYRTIYVTVRAYNRAGLYSEAVSNGFIVDSTPPEITQPPVTSDIGSIFQNTSVYRGTIRVKWEATDSESFIDTQYISVNSHVGGDFNLSSVQLDGISRDYTLTGLDLHDGSYYCVTVIVCNGAKICTSAMSNKFLVDSSPPTPGMFAINTQHAANLRRQPDGWMKWTIYSIKLAWLGFVDVHSNIDHYEVAVGSSYMGSDLNEIEGAPAIVNHNETFVFNAGDEGGVQTAPVKTKSLNKHDYVFISIWAVNGVGLSSPIIHSEFKLAFNGKMELERRCSAVTCAGHCVCAPHGKTCSNMNCGASSELTSKNIRVIDVQDLTFPSKANIVRFVPTNTLLAATWSVDSHEGDTPKWYEWSVGVSISNKPSGVFSPPHDRVWHDAGQLKQFIFILPRGKTLSENVQYSFFVRAWFSNNTLAIGKSPGVTIETKCPSTTNKLGKAVKELVNGKQDVDFIAENQICTIDWQDKFLRSAERISRFRVYISTSPGGHDVHVSNANLPATNTSYNIAGVALQPHIRYYANVQAYNHAGLHTTVTSDGFLLDTLPPKPGIVFDGEGFKDLDFHNSSNRVGAFWHDFSDQESGILSYKWCVSKGNGNHSYSVYSDEDVSLHTSAARTLNKSLNLGTRLIHDVFAIDAVGHHSKVVSSDGVVVDTTPPDKEQRQLHGDNILKNPSFEEDNSALTWQELKKDRHCLKYGPQSWNLSSSSCVTLIKTKTEFTTNGHNFAFIEGSIHQTLSKLELSEIYQVTFYCSHLPFHFSTSSNKEGFISFGGDKHVFMMYNKPARADHVPEVEEAMLSWHHHTFYFTAMSENVTFMIGNTEKSDGIAIDNISVQRYSRLDVTVSDANVKAHAVLIEDWSSIHASWSFQDTESPIVDYTWAIGYVQGGTQLQNFQSVGLRTFAYSSSIEPVHGSTVHVTVVATNAAELRTVSYSNPVIIDLTPPEILFVFDGLGGTDIDFQRSSEISAIWEVRDAETGIEACQWAAGAGTNSSGLLSNFTDVPTGVREITTTFDMQLVADKTIYITIRCKNKAGLVEVKSSDGVRVVHSIPNANSTIVEVIGPENSQYPRHDNYYNDPKDFRLKWTGFTEDIGINGYLVELDGMNSHYSELVNGRGSSYTFASLEGFNLRDGLYSVSVTAVSHLGLNVQRTERNITMLTEKPKRNDEDITTAWNPSTHEATIWWNNVFIFDHPLYYEVSVGTHEGGADVVQWQETRDTVLKLALKKNSEDSGTQMYVSVRAISPSGTFNDAHGTFNIGTL